MTTIKIYTAKHCAPCRQVEEFIKNGKFEGEIELIDIETDEGFQKFKEEVLDHEDGAVPSAYKNGKRCLIQIDEDNNLLINCPDDPPSSDEG